MGTRAGTERQQTDKCRWHTTGERLHGAPPVLVLAHLVDGKSVQGTIFPVVFRVTMVAFFLAKFRSNQA